MRLIDADELLTDPYFQDESMPERELFIEAVEDSPTIDAEPVRHGRWGTYHITGYDGLHPTYTVPCLECSYEATFTHRFCPNCGATMMDAEVEG